MSALSEVICQSDVIRSMCHFHAPQLSRGFLRTGTRLAYAGQLF